MNRLHSLDSLKFVCAIMVVFIHYEILYTPFFNAFDRCAVPIFYMISGFFLGGAENINGNRIFRIIKRVTAILFVASLLYTVQIIHSKANIFSYINPPFRKFIYAQLVILFELVAWLLINHCNEYLGFDHVLIS